LAKLGLGKLQKSVTWRFFVAKAPRHARSPYTDTYVYSIYLFCKQRRNIRGRAWKWGQFISFPFVPYQFNFEIKKKYRGLSDNPPCGFPIFLRLLHFRKITIPCTHKNILCLNSVRVNRKDLYIKIFPSSLFNVILSLLLTYVYFYQCKLILISV